MKDEGNTKTYIVDILVKFCITLIKVLKMLKNVTLMQVVIKINVFVKKNVMLEQCTPSNCDSLCQSTPKCEFVASGRH